MASEQTMSDFIYVHELINYLLIGYEATSQHLYQLKLKENLSIVIEKITLSVISTIGCKNNQMEN